MLVWHILNLTWRLLYSATYNHVPKRRASYTHLQLKKIQFAAMFFWVCNVQIPLNSISNNYRSFGRFWRKPGTKARITTLHRLWFNNPGFPIYSVLNWRVGQGGNNPFVGRRKLLCWIIYSLKKGTSGQQLIYFPIFSLNISVRLFGNPDN